MEKIAKIIEDKIRIYEYSRGKYSYRIGCSNPNECHSTVNYCKKCDFMEFIEKGGK